MHIESQKIQYTLKLRRFNGHWISKDSIALNLRRFNVHWISEDSMWTKAQKIQSKRDYMCIESKEIQCESKRDSISIESEKIQCDLRRFNVDCICIK